MRTIQHHKRLPRIILRRRKMPNCCLPSMRKSISYILLRLLLIALIRTSTVSCRTCSSGRGRGGTRTCVVAPVSVTDNTSMHGSSRFYEPKRRRGFISHTPQATYGASNTPEQIDSRRLFKHRNNRSNLLQVKVSSRSIRLILRKTSTIGTTIDNHKNVNSNCWWKAALSGSIAGGVATTILYPLDAAKTLRQAHLASFSTSTGAATTTASASLLVPPIASVYDALRHLIRQRTVYVGLSTAVLGAIPSSALYFGAYETSKSFIGRTFIHRNRNHRRLTPSGSADSEEESDVPILQRCLWHSTSAAIGNLVSSAIFVPKELIKQQMQYSGTGTSNLLRSVRHIITEKGIRNGLYVGYRATVLRNIPSAALRFTFYEELKRYINRGNVNDLNGKKHNTTWKLYVAGAMAGAMASGIMTPMDLIKTKLSTGTCPVNEVQGCIQYVIAQNGIIALWTGAGSRMISSALFSAIGFGTFEACQSYLNHHHWCSRRSSDSQCKRK